MRRWWRTGWVGEGVLLGGAASVPYVRLVLPLKIYLASVGSAATTIAASLAKAAAAAFARASATAFAWACAAAFARAASGVTSGGSSGGVELLHSAAAFAAHDCSLVIDARDEAPRGLRSQCITRQSRGTSVVVGGVHVGDDKVGISEAIGALVNGGRVALLVAPFDATLDVVKVAHAPQAWRTASKVGCCATSKANEVLAAKDDALVT